MQIFRHLTASEVYLEAFPFKRELSMEAYLIENEQVLSLDNDSFSNVEIVETELSIKLGRGSINTDGRLDILATYSQEYIAVIELKLGQLEEKHLVQLEDYLEQRDQILKKYPDILDQENYAPKWIGVLVGTTITPDLAMKLTMGYTAKSGIQIAGLTIQRYRGKDAHIYITTDTFFKPTKTSNDNTRYKFEGLNYGKGRLVLAVIKKYVETHPNTSYAELEKLFPQICQGSYGVFARYEKANEIAEIRKRHFLNPEDLINLSDCTIAVCSQWGAKSKSTKGNIENFINRAIELSYLIEPINT